MPHLVVDFCLSFTLISVSWIFGYLFFRLSEKLGFVDSLLIKNSPFFSFVYKFLQVEWFRWLLVNTPLRYTSEKIHLRNHGEAELLRVRREMIDSEVSHHVGFWLCLLGSLLYLWGGGRGSLFVVLSFFNLLGNFYPVLVQIQNRSRINVLLKVRKKTSRVLPVRN